MSNVEVLPGVAQAREAAAADLARSGLEIGDMKLRLLGPSEKQATGTPQGTEGYVIPYFDIWGNPLSFYRAKLFTDSPDELKYRQMANSTNHIYFPPGLSELLPKAKYLLWTEGEKKAAAAVKNGFPCVAVGGVESWRNRTLIMNKATKLGQSARGNVVAKLPPGTEISEGLDTVAIGFQQVIDLLLERDIPLVICYDSDFTRGRNEDATHSQGPRPIKPIKPEVQRASAALGFELRFRGVAIRNIRQHILLPGSTDAAPEKLGLDDYLLHADLGPVELSKGLLETLTKRSAFPVHPNPKEYINQRLQKSNLSRKEAQQLAMTILTDLDAKGQRLRSEDSGMLYYFSNDNRALTRVVFSNDMDLAETPFGRELYSRYGVSHADRRLIDWLAAQFSGEGPINSVSPERVLAWRGDTFHYQLNDGQQVVVTHDSIKVIDNGERDVLFESGMVAPVDEDAFRVALESVRAEPFTNWWFDVLKEARIKDNRDLTQRRLLSLHYYISPWFYKWRGTQLPVEITTGEPGSGKSTLYQLRLGIGTGIPKLRNPPETLRDWVSSLAGAGGLHVTDNVQFVDAALRQKLSDEICRLITEPNPAFEQRKLYTDNTIIRMPVKTVFAITSVKQPFSNVDIIQRAIITEMDKGDDPDLEYDGEWEQHKMSERGGRPYWLAHHLVFIQRLLQENQKSWALRYKAKYRLINVEQLLQQAAKVFAWDHTWIPPYLETVRNKRTEEGDWALQGLHAYATAVRESDPNYQQNFCKASTIAQWAEQHPDYAECTILTNARSVGKYLATHRHLVATTAGIVYIGSRGNSEAYGVRALPADISSTQKAQLISHDGST